MSQTPPGSTPWPQPPTGTHHPAGPFPGTGPGPGLHPPGRGGPSGPLIVVLVLAAVLVVGGGVLLIAEDDDQPGATTPATVVTTPGGPAGEPEGPGPSEAPGGTEVEVVPPTGGAEEEGAATPSGTATPEATVDTFIAAASGGDCELLVDVSINLFPGSREEQLRDCQSVITQLQDIFIFVEATGPAEVTGDTATMVVTHAVSGLDGTFELVREGDGWLTSNFIPPPE